jgi:hypothetical protein
MHLDRNQKIELGIAAVGVSVSILGIYLYQRGQSGASSQQAATAQELAAENAAIAQALQGLPNSGGAGSGGGTTGSSGITVPPLDTSAGGLLDHTGPSDATAATGSSQSPESIQAASNAAMLAEGYTIVNGQFVPPAAPAPAAPAASAVPTIATRVAAVTKGLFGTTPAAKDSGVPVKVYRRTSPAPAPIPSGTDAGARSGPPVTTDKTPSGSGRVPATTAAFASRVAAVTNGLFGTAPAAKGAGSKVLVRVTPGVPAAPAPAAPTTTAPVIPARGRF